MQIKIYDIKGKLGKKEDFVSLKKKPKDNLILMISRVFNLSQLKSSHTKTRAERRGGGAKPWRQKGTGRARVGSNRTPLWRKGGIIFGPRKEKNYEKKINKKSRNIAKLHLLGQKIKSREAFIWNVSAQNLPKKTKEAEIALLKLPLKTGTVLVLTGKKENFKSLKNISYLTLKRAAGLNLSQILKFNNLIFTKSGFYEKKFNN
ncbi:50S ribosomal protein L4 [Patescibacteria group bacterium]|nr:50S ribosomal protein L4 [Patescibacteria group bacterium]